MLDLTKYQVLTDNEDLLRFMRGVGPKVAIYYRGLPEDRTAHDAKMFKLVRKAYDLGRVILFCKPIAARKGSPRSYTHYALRREKVLAKPTKFNVSVSNGR